MGTLYTLAHRPRVTPPSWARLTVNSLPQRDGHCLELTSVCLLVVAESRTADKSPGPDPQTVDLRGFEPLTSCLPNIRPASLSPAVLRPWSLGRVTLTTPQYLRVPVTAKGFLIPS
jgi:hypothetical protein